MMRLPVLDARSGQALAGLGLGLALALALVGMPRLVHAYTLAFDFLAAFERWPALVGVAAIAVLMAIALPLATVAPLTAVAAAPRRLLLGILVFALQAMSLRLGPLNLLNLTIPLLVMWWLADCVRRAEVPRQVPVMGHLLVLLGVLAAISLFNHEPVDSLRSMLILAPKLAMAWVLLQVLRNADELDFVLRMLIASSLLAAFLGLAQVGLYVFYQWELHLMDETAPRYITVFGLPLLRASGLLPNPQAYVHPLMFAAVLLACRWFNGAGGPRWHPAAWGGLVVLLAAIGLSFARGPWAALLVGLLLLPVALRPRLFMPWFAVLAVVALLVLWSGLGRWLIDSAQEFTSGSADVRVELLAAGLEVLADHPLRGVGMSGFEFVSPTLERYPVHNALMQMATEIGLPALLLFVAMLLLPVLRAATALRRLGLAESQRLRALLVAYFVFIIAIQGDPMAYSEFVFFIVVLLDAAARIDGAAPDAARATSGGGR